VSGGTRASLVPVLAGPARASYARSLTVADWSLLAALAPLGWA
jgi:hypothetical protein